MTEPSYRTEFAHTIRASDDDSVTYLCVSTTRSPDVVLYPDSNKVGAFGKGHRLLLDGESQLGYWDREPTS